MQTLNLLEDQIGTLDDAQTLINEFHWFLHVDDIAGIWTIRSGEAVIFSADSRDAVDAFIYGMALAYKGLPAHLYAKLFGMMAGLPPSTYGETITLAVTEVDPDLMEDDEQLGDDFSA